MYNLAMQPQNTASPPPDILVTGHFKELHGYAVYRSRGSGNWLITYTLQGQGLYRQPGLEMLTSPGDIVLLQPGALHDYSVPPGGSWEFLWAHFQPKVTWLSWWHLPEVGQGLFKVSLHTLQVRERARQAFFNLYADACASQAHDVTFNITSDSPHFERVSGEPLSTIQRDLAINGLEEILLLAVQENTQSSDRPLDPRVQRVLELIVQNLSSQHTLNTLASAVALSPSRLAHLFKQEVGDSVTDMLLTLRLNKAARLLEFTVHDVKMIAEEVGFSSAFYFSRQFRQHFGMSPRDYRTMMASKGSRTR